MHTKLLMNAGIYSFCPFRGVLSDFVLITISRSMTKMSWLRLGRLLLYCQLLCTVLCQRFEGDFVPQVKILTELFPVSNAQQVNQITWRVLGRMPAEVIYCVSEPPVSQLRFVCLDCAQKNITDMVNVLNSAQDLTRNAGFPV